MFTDIRNVVIKLSNTCNMNCTYCFEKDKFKPTRFTDYEALLQLLKTIDFKSDDVFIKFTGGEPLVYEKDIREAFKTLKKLERFKDVRVHFSLTTNGSYMNELLGLYDDGILDPNLCKISWDGIHTCTTRKTSVITDLDMKNNIKLLGESGYGDKTTIRMALTTETLTDLYFSFLYALQNKCSVLEYYYIMDYDLYSDKDFIKRAKIVFNELAQLTIVFDFTYINWDTITRSNSNTDPAYKSICKHLGNILYIDGVGDIYPCSFYSKDSIYENTDFIIGTVYKGLDSSRTAQFVARYYGMRLCDDTKCQNKHCFECPAANMYKSKNRLKQTCELRTIEKEIYDEYHIE